MFENLIGQSAAVGSLRQELAAGTFPRAVLFSGPRWAGKLTAALETARVLTCQAGGDWSCECPSCRLQRELAHPGTLLLGWRAMDEEIAASAQSYHANQRSHGVATRFLLLRAVRKLTRRFDPAVWDAEPGRQRTAQERIGAIEELLADEERLDGSLEKLITLCAGLSASVKNDHISVGQVRLLGSWAHLGAEPRVAIVDNADRMQDSARNALLKLLEEPPEPVHVVLTTTRRSAIIPTILSRTRPYHFVQRSAEEEREVIGRVFREDPAAHTGLRGFFLSWRDPPLAALRAAARSLIERSCDPAASLDVPDDVAAVVGRGAPPERTLAFLEELLAEFRTLLREGAVGVEVLEGWTEAVRECQGRVDQLFIRPENALLGLLARMRGCAGAAPRSPEAA